MWCHSQPMTGQGHVILLSAFGPYPYFSFFWGSFIRLGSLLGQGLGPELDNYLLPWYPRLVWAGSEPRPPTYSAPRWPIYYYYYYYYSRYTTVFTTYLEATSVPPHQCLNPGTAMDTTQGYLLIWKYMLYIKYTSVLFWVLRESWERAIETTSWRFKRSRLSALHR